MRRQPFAPLRPRRLVRSRFRGVLVGAVAVLGLVTVAAAAPVTPAAAPADTSSLAPALTLSVAAVQGPQGLDAALRIAMAELLVADGLKGRPAWVRVGAARYFAHAVVGRVSNGTLRTGSRDRCPADAELTLAISAPAQRDAEARAESCFAREYARTKDWRAVR